MCKIEKNLINLYHLCPCALQKLLFFGTLIFILSHLISKGNDRERKQERETGRQKVVRERECMCKHKYRERKRVVNIFENFNQGERGSTWENEHIWDRKIAKNVCVERWSEEWKTDERKKCERWPFVKSFQREKQLSEKDFNL